MWNWVVETMCIYINICIHTWIFLSGCQIDDKGYRKTPSLRVQTAPELEDASLQTISCSKLNPFSGPVTRWDSSKLLGAKVALERLVGS